MAGSGTQLVTHMMQKNRQEEEQAGMTGSLEKQSDHETHLDYKSRSMYHGVSNLVKPFFGPRSPAVR